MKTIDVEIFVKLTLKVSDHMADLDIDDFINELDYSFKSEDATNGNVENSEIVEYSWEELVEN